MAVGKSPSIRGLTPHGVRDVGEERRIEYPHGSPRVSDSGSGIPQDAAHITSKTVGVKSPQFPLTAHESEGIEGDLAFLSRAIEIGKSGGMEGERLKLFAARCAEEMMKAFVEHLKSA